MRRACLLLLTSLLAVAPSSGQTEIIDTIAGGGPPDGVPASSSYFDIGDIAVDADGNVYFPSVFDHRLYMIDGNGIVHHVAGTGIEQPIGDGETADRASFLLPTSLVLTPEGDFIIYEGADYRTNYEMPPPPIGRKSLRLRRIDGTTGLVSTIPTPGELSVPYDLLLGPSGDLFLSGCLRRHHFDPGCRDDIRRFDPVSGAMSELTRIDDAFPRLAIDLSGHLFASDALAALVHSIDLGTGTIADYAGDGTPGDGGDGGPATAAQVTPRGLIVNSEGDLFIAALGRVRVVDAQTGIIETVAGNGIYDTTGDGGPATSASVKAVQLGFDGDENLTISGCSRGPGLSLGCDVRKVDASTGIISTVARTAFTEPFGDGGPAAVARLGNPQDLAVASNGDLYILDPGFTAIWKVAAETERIEALLLEEPLGADRNGGRPASLNGIALHPDGSIYYSTHLTFGELIDIYSWNAVWRLDPVAGPVEVVHGSFPWGYDGDGGPAIDATLNEPYGLVFDQDGNLFIADSGNDVIRRIDAATGIITTYAGGGPPDELGDGGPALGATLDRPTGLAVDALGNLFIGDNGHRRVRRIDATEGTITTVAGNGEPGATGDGGPATEAGIGVSLIALDTEGNLYISGNDRVRRVDAATGIIDTIAGDGTLGFHGDGGPPLEASLGGPRGLAFDGDGNLLIAAYDARRIRRVGKPLRVTATPSVLPRSHELVDIALTVEGTRLFEPVQILLDSVVSNEPDDVPGGSDGHTVDDIQDADTGTADFAIKLRGERDARGEGRVYTIRYVGIDADGVEAFGEARVLVPRAGPQPK